MIKIAILLITLCVAQFQTIYAETEEERNIGEITEIITELTNSIKDTITDISTRLPAIALTLQTDIQEVIKKNSIQDILLALKDDIAKLLPVGASGVVKCGKLATTNIETLKTNIQKMSADCATNAATNSEDMKTQMEVLIEKANELPTGVVDKIQGCVQQNSEEAIVLATCLKSKIKAIKEILNELHTEAKNTIDITERVADDTVTEMQKCMTLVQNETLKQSKTILSHINNCMSEL